MDILTRRIKELKTDIKHNEELLDYINSESDEALGLSKQITEDYKEIMDLEEAIRKLETFDKLRDLPEELKEDSASENNRLLFTEWEYGRRALDIMLEHSKQVLRDLSNT